MADTGPISEPIRSILVALSEAIFPLSFWLQARGPEGYVPPIADLPWRAPGARLSVTDLKPIDFLERMLATDPDQALEARWNRLIASPPLFGTDPASWRAERGLRPAGRFGILDSDNFFATLMNPDGSKRAVRLAEFYAAVWAGLRAAVDAAKPATTRDWQNLLEQLRSNKIAAWPGRPAPTSGEFVIRFTADCLYALLNFSNGLPSPWDAALAIEVGEFRRPDPTITTNQVAAQVAALMNKIG